MASVLQEGRDPGQLSAVRERARQLVPHEDADAVEDFVRQLYRWVPEEDLRAHRVPELAGAALSLWRLVRERDTGPPAPGRPPLVRAFVPDEGEHGWRSPHTIVQVVTDDMPFLVDSVTAEVVVPQSGAEGVIVAQGGSIGGWSLYVKYG